MNKPTLLLTMLAFAASILVAQSVPNPAPPQTHPILLRGGILHRGDGSPASPGDILFHQGKIQALGTITTVPDSTQIIDLPGKHIYPGLIAPNTDLGLQEIEAVRATRDIEEPGHINPNMRAIVAYNTDSRVTPTVRSNGILLAQIVPQGGLFAGSSAVVQLDAWTWEEATYLPDDALHLYWPNMHLSSSRFAPPAEEQKKRTRDNLERINQAMLSARAYHQAKREGTLKKLDQRWEAMIPLLEKKKSLWVHATTERQIRAVLAFKAEHDLNIVLVGGADAWVLADMLQRQQVPVVLEKPHNLPRLEDADVDLPYKQARILHDAGVLVALSVDGFWNQRNLPFMAGTAVAHGLDPEKALQMITANPAQILGIQSRTGTLTTGLDANIIVSTGDLLDMRTSNIELAYIQGRKLDLGNHHLDLYKKFQSRYTKP